MDIENLYNSLHIEDNEQDDAIDTAGYIGNFHRADPKDAKDLTQAQLIELFKDEDKIDELKFTIRSIDRDHNGYITWNEMEDILKILYPEPLQNKRLK